MKIAVIRLNMFDHISSDAMKPILFGILKGLTPERFQIEFYDERTDKLPECIDADVIAFSVETFTAKRAYIMAKRYRTQTNIIAMGGFHASVMADEMLRYADTVLVGDAEGTWERFLTDCESGKPKRKYIADESTPLTALFDDGATYKHRYYGIGVHQLSRGCKFNCGFCSIKTMYKCVRRKPVDMIVRELSAAKEKIIFFADDNIFYDRQSAVELFRALIPLKKKWACQISMDAARDDELLTLMKKSGCFLVLMGFESLSRESLAEMHKAANLASDYDALIQNIYRHGLLLYGTFVLGCDGDRADVFEKTYEFAVRNKIAVTNFNPLIPMPGTEVYARMEREGRLRYRKWWLSDRYRYGETAFVPKHMSPEDLQNGCLKMRTDYYSLGCIFKRLFGNKYNFLPLNLFVFMAANLISGKEIKKKQGQMLGGVLGEADAD